MARINKKFKCEFLNGKPVLEDEKGFRESCLKLNEKVGFVTITPCRKLKSVEQGSYYRGVVVQLLAEYWGCTNDEAHEAISNEHLKYRLRPEMPEIVLSTALSEWNTVDWENYMKHLRQWAILEFGVYIPEPNEVDLLSLPKAYH